MLKDWMVFKLAGIFSALATIGLAWKIFKFWDRLPIGLLIPFIVCDIIFLSFSATCWIEYANTRKE